MTLQTEIFAEGEAVQTAFLPALPSRLDDIVAARDAALSKAKEAAAKLTVAYSLSDEAVSFALKAQVGRKYSGLDRTGNKHYTRLFKDGFDEAESVEIFRRQLDASVWSQLYEEVGIREMMDATAAREFDQGLRGDVPELTLANIRATFENLMGNADLIFARGLAVAFSKLDERFKSHDAFKLGSRMILESVFSDFSGSLRSEETIIDVERVFAKLDGGKPAGRTLVDEINNSRPGYSPQQSTTESTYLRIKGYLNGNAHLWFTRDDLVEKANKVLADYYGDVIPDAAEKNEDEQAFRKRTNLPARKLQFYATPTDAAERLLDRIDWREGMKVLEPSAGEGHLVSHILKKGADVTAVEIQEDRLLSLREFESSKCHVIGGNFLNQPSHAGFHAVAMNPPFSGTHWMDHVRHAFDFLAENGQLVAILPASAKVNQSKAHIRFRRWAEENCGRYSRHRMWIDLPLESFSTSGTNINTVILKLVKG